MASTADIAFCTRWYGDKPGGTISIRSSWTDWSATGLPNDFAKTGTLTATNDSPTDGGADDEYGDYATS